MDTLAASLRRALRDDAVHGVQFVTPAMRAKKDPVRRAEFLRSYLGQGCYLRTRHADDFISVDVYIRLWQSNAHRGESWHDYLVPAEAGYVGWTLTYRGRDWRLALNHDPRYRQRACLACRDPRIRSEDGPKPSPGRPKRSTT